MLRQIGKASAPMFARTLQMKNSVTRMVTTQNDATSDQTQGLSLEDIPKSNVFTSNLPADAAFPTPADSHRAPRETLGPRMVREALYTFVRPEKNESPVLLASSVNALKDLGLKAGEENRDLFRDVVSGNRILTWDESMSEGIYPWAQCYGGGHLRRTTQKRMADRKRRISVVCLIASADGMCCIDQSHQWAVGRPAG